MGTRGARAHKKHEGEQLRDPDDLLREKIERILARAPRVPIVSQLQRHDEADLHEAEAMLSTEDVCHLLEGEGDKMYFLCSSPPDNDNLACSQAADGMDWVCRERRGDEANDMLFDRIGTLVAGASPSVRATFDHFAKIQRDPRPPQ